jgi:hypothetical protein
VPVSIRKSMMPCRRPSLFMAAQYREFRPSSNPGRHRRYNRENRTKAKFLVIMFRFDGILFASDCCPVTRIAPGGMTKGCGSLEIRPEASMG